MTKATRPSWLRPLCRLACVVAAAAALSGCIVAPYPAHPHYYWNR